MPLILIEGFILKRLLQTRNKLITNKDHVSRKTIRNKEHIVVSGVKHMIGDAVMNSVHYPANETIKLSNSLGNKRIVMPSSHPTGDEGEFISASDPLALMSNFVGAFAFNFSMRGDLLISDIAIDPAVANTSESGRQIINAIENGDPIDVSTGFFLNIDEVEGFGSDGEPFTGVASNLFLDHVAFLPNETGAKNKFEGVGLHVNSAVDNDGNSLDTDVVELFTNASVPAMNLPLAPADHTWDASAAVGRVREFSKSADKPSTNFRKFFFAFDQDDAENFGAYKLPFVDIIDGKPMAVKAAIDNAKARLDQTKISDDDKASALSAIEKYQTKFDKQASNSSKDGVFSRLLAWAKNMGYNEHDKKQNGDDMIVNSAKLAARLKSLLDEKSGGDRDKRSELVDRMASAAGISRSTVDQILGETIDIPPDNRLSGFAKVLGVSLESLKALVPTTNSNGDSTMLDRKQVIALLAAKNITVNADISDDDLKAKLTEAMNTKADPTPAPVGISLDDVTAAVNAAIKPLQDQLNANSEKEQGELAGKVVALDIGIDEESAKTMSVNSLKAILAKSGKPAFNSNGRQQYQSSTDNGLDNELPE